jgi:hypothetical protein
MVRLCLGTRVCGVGCRWMPCVSDFHAAVYPVCVAGPLQLPWRRLASRVRLRGGGEWVVVCAGFHNGPQARYAEMVASGAIVEDRHQLTALQHMQALYNSVIGTYGVEGCVCVPCPTVWFRHDCATARCRSVCSGALCSLYSGTHTMWGGSWWAPRTAVRTWGACRRRCVAGPSRSRH